MKINKIVWTARGISLFAAAVFGLGASTLQVGAIEAYTDPVGTMIGYQVKEDENKPVYLSGAIGILVNGEKGLITAAYDNSSDVAIISTSNTEFGFIISEEQYENIGEVEMCLWDLSDEENVETDDFVEISYPIQNEEAVLAYLCASADGDGDLSRKTSRVIFQEQEGKILTVNTLPNDMILYPAPILDQSGKLVAVLLEGDIVLAINGDEELFYGSSSGSDSGSSGGSDSGSSGGSDSGSSSGDSNGSETSRYEGYAGGQNGINIENVFLAGIIVLAIGVAVIVIITRKKPDPKKENPASVENVWKAPADSGSQPFGRECTTPPVSPAHPIPPAGQPAQQFGLALEARGGYMDGQVFPVGRTEITFGRGYYCTVKYPEKYPGVSGAHAKLYWEDGRLMLMDEGSSYGTYLENTGRLMPMVPIPVNRGDMFFLGERKNCFVIRN